jgi:predicted metal-binding membrane protein
MPDPHDTRPAARPRDAARPMAASIVSRVLARDTHVTAVWLVVLAALAWVYVWRGAGTGMSALDMTELVLFPHLHSGAMDDMAMPFAWMTAVAMWWVMMIAMMTPSAAPLILLHARAAGRAGGVGNLPAWAGSAALVAGYLGAWLAFSLAAAALQRALLPTGLVSPMMLWSRSAVLSAGVLALAGFYQISPLKQRCLAQCRSPVSFIALHWRPGLAGAFAMGLRHGGWCVGCCWMLMALLFVGGIMNLAWIAALSVLVLVEKVAPGGVWVSRVTGVLLLTWAAATLLV